MYTPSSAPLPIHFRADTLINSPVTTIRQGVNASVTGVQVIKVISERRGATPG
jgi:hypothetical protein